ncbi:MAG: MtrB/PioB family outer membrane beta-barrel protein, partial [Pseudomonadota bacterium]
RIDTTALNLVLNTRPLRRLSMNIRFRLDDRDNQTDREQYVTLRGDAEAQNTAEASNRRRFNRPFDYQEQTIKVDARYRLGMRSRLFGSVERKRVKRRFSERERVVENRAVLGWARALATEWNIQLDGEVADRTGSTFEGEIALAEGFTPEYAATVPGGFINLPGLRHFHLADRRRHQARARLNYTPAQAWAIGLEAALSADDYRQSELGLTDSTNDSITAQFSYTPSEQWSTHAFARIERMTFDQDGQSIRGFNKLPDAANLERRWLADQSDRVQSFGTGIRWQPTGREIEFEADYTFVRSRSRIDVQTGADLTSAPLPSVDTSLHSVRLQSHWHINNTTSIGLSWWFERFRSDQFALDTVAVDQLANIILPGETSPDYQVHVLSLSLRYRF